MGPGARIAGRYLVDRPVGRGGFGTVYRARTPEGALVAVKVLARRDPETLARFGREVRLQASLGEGEGFVPVLDSGEGPEGPFLVMPFLPGGTLRDRLTREGPWPVLETVAVLGAVSRAVGRAHALGIVHRDLKPENVLFTADGRPLVSDLGLAKHFRDDAPGSSRSLSVSTTGNFVGTAGYVPVEQLEDAKTAGPPADVFALGAILYECLAGHPAFSGESVVEVLNRISNGSYAPLRRSRPDVPDWLDAVVTRALVLEPERRQPDGLALANALVAGAARPSRRWAPLVAPGALALLGGAVGAAWALAPAPPPPPERPAPRRTPDGKARALELVARAKDAYARGEPDAAIAEATQAIALDPALAAAFLVRAGARWKKHEPIETVVADYARATELDPKDPQAWLQRGRALGVQGDHEGSLRDLDRALALDPKLVRAWFARGSLKGDLGDQDGALADLDRAIELDPGYAVAWNARGKTKARKGDHAGAVRDLDRAIELDPKDPHAWTGRGIFKSELGDRAGAAADYERALELAPDDPNAPALRRAIEEQRRRGRSP